jgi:leucyl aminopeptidase (aminopeptidase T)
LRRAVRNLLAKSLSLGSNDSLAFIHDETYRQLREPIREAAAETGVRALTVEISHDGIQPLSPEVAALLLGSEHDVVLFGLVHNIWHTPERKRAKYDLRKRLASLVCAPDDLGTGASLADIDLLSRVARTIAPFFSGGSFVRVRSVAGTDFTCVIGIPFCEDGRYDQPGTGGDFPAGEVGFGPVLGSVNGKIIYDLKVQHVGILHSPLACIVSHDRIVEVEGVHQDKFLEICRDRGDVLRYISEVSVGINPDGLLTPAPHFIPEEKNYGTMHCGHGGNASYGSRAGPHLDGVMNKPTIEINGVVLMKDGKLSPNLVDPDLWIWLNSPK